MKPELGRVVMTAAVAHEMENNSEFILFVAKSLRRHANGDWGDLCDEDWEENLICLDEGCRLFSSYKKDAPHKDLNIWIITEADRSYTTVSFPNDY